MDSPIETCMQFVSAVCVLIERDNLDVRTWSAVEQCTDTESHVSLMVAEPEQSAAFAEITFNCSIPSEGFGRRIVEIQVRSNHWMEESLPILADPHMPELLSNQIQLLDDAIISYNTVYRAEPAGEGTIVTRKEVSVKFRSRLSEFDLNEYEQLDEIGEATFAVEQLEKLLDFRRAISPQKAYEEEKAANFTLRLSTGYEVEVDLSKESRYWLSHLANAIVGERLIEESEGADERNYEALAEELRYLLVAVPQPLKDALLYSVLSDAVDRILSKLHGSLIDKYMAEANSG